MEKTNALIKRSSELSDREKNISFALLAITFESLQGIAHRAYLNSLNSPNTTEVQKNMTRLLAEIKESAVKDVMTIMDLSVSHLTAKEISQAFKEDLATIELGK